MAPVALAFSNYPTMPSFTARDILSSLASAFTHDELPRSVSLSPSQTEFKFASRIVARQSQSGPIDGIIPTFYQLGGPAPGTVVGIVLGSVAGFLLIVWLIQTLMNSNGGAAIAGEEEIVVRRPARSRRSRRSNSTRNVEVRQVSRSPRRERIIVEDRRSAAPPPPRSPHRSRSIIVEERFEERRVPGDDIVEVIEEDTISDLTPPPRRQRSRRGSQYR